MRIIRRAIEERLEPGLNNEERSAVNGEFKRHALPFYELSDTLEQVDYQIRFLAGLIHRLAQDIAVNGSSSIRILRNPDEIADHIFNNEADFVMLTSPEHMPIVIKRRDWGWVKDKDEFADWLTVNWRSEMLVIAVL